MALSAIVAKVAKVKNRAFAIFFVGALASLQGSGPARAATTFTIEGRGWGHGVGMSQWGAKGLADKGWTGKQILQHFYQGTAITKLPTPAEIRVGLIQEQAYIDVTGNGRFDFHDNKGALRAYGQSGQTWRVQPTPAGSTQLGVYDPSGKLVFTSGVPITLDYESRATLVKLPKLGYQYRHGRIDFDVNVSSGKERAILILPFEQYLYGLGEMPSSWHMEALKAQAIAGRTYALEKITRLGQSRPVCNCAMYSTTVDQAYVGSSAEVSRWVNAVNSTKSQASTYNGKAIQAYYSSSDGGYNENNENVFGGDPLPYLRGACDPGDYAGGSNPNANWSVSMDGTQMGQRLAGGGYSIGTVQSLTVVPPRGVSGRVLKVIDSGHGGMRVTGSSGTARVPGTRFQWLLGLKSTLLNRIIKGDIRLRYDDLNCGPGLASNDEYTWKDLSGVVRGSAQDFAGGRLFRNASTSKVFWTRGPILARYDDLRRHGNDLGLPVGDEFAVSGGRRSNFERGNITLNSSTGNTTYVLYS